jgi:hypothetical protein
LLRKHLVDLLAFRQDVVKRDVADDRAQRRRRDALRRAGEVAHLDDAQPWVNYLPVNQEVDVDRCVVLGDTGLRGDFQEVLAQVTLVAWSMTGQSQTSPARARRRSDPAGTAPTVRSHARCGWDER